MSNQLDAVFETGAFRHVVKWLLAAPFAVSGVTKLLGFEGTVAEVAGMGLPLPSLFAAGTVALQLLGSLAIVTGVLAGVGALALAGFTVVATLLAHAFWTHPAGQQFGQMMTFLEHAAIVGGLLAFAALDAGERHATAGTLKRTRMPRTA